MTTDKRPAARASTTLEVRLYLVALLGVVYIITWRAIGGHASTGDAQLATARPASESPRSLWIDELPPEARPVIAMPRGWQRTSEPSRAAQPARVVRLPSRAPRVRTRSS